MNRVFAVLAPFIILAALPWHSFSQSDGQLKVMATVVKQDGSPADGLFVNLFKVKGNKLVIDMDGKGTVTNPQAKCDSKGQLTILVPSGYLKPGDEFTLGKLLRFELRDENGNLATFKYPDRLERNTINLGTITLIPK